MSIYCFYILEVLVNFSISVTKQSFFNQKIVAPEAEIEEIEIICKSTDIDLHLGLGPAGKQENGANMNKSADFKVKT